MQTITGGDNNAVWCDGCGAEVSWAPVVARDGQYCCDDCAAGLWCACRERTSLDLDERVSPPPGMPLGPGSTGWTGGAGAGG